MDFMAGNILKIIFHRFDLPLPVFRGSKGPFRKKLSLQQLRRPYRIHTSLVSANAAIMWCMECIWISYRMRLWERAPVCMEGEVFRLPCFSVNVSLWNPRDGCVAVGLAAGQGGPVFMHPSRSLGAVPGPHRIHGVLLSAVRGSHGFRPCRQPSSFALSPRHVTAPYATLP